MEKTVIKKVPLKVQELKKLRQVIHSELAKNIEAQIFVEKPLYDEIKFNYFDFNMEPEDDETATGHYVSYVQNFYELQNARGHHEGMIGFAANCKGFMQVTKFQFGEVDYIHHNRGMKKILIIYKDEN